MTGIRIARRGDMAAAASSASYMAAVLADSPLGYWKVDETAGTSAADSSGNGHTASYINAPTLGVAPLISTGKAVTVNGVSQYVDIPAVAALNPSAAISLEGWLKTSTAGAQRLISEQGGSAAHNKGFLRINAGNTGDFTVFDTSNVAHTITGATTLTSGSTHYLVGTYDGTTLRLYVDGVSDAAGVAATFTLQATSGWDWVLGARLTDAFALTEQLHGTLDEAAIYGTALSAARVAAHYAAR